MNYWYQFILLVEPRSQVSLFNILTLSFQSSNSNKINVLLKMNVLLSVAYSSRQ